MDEYRHVCACTEQPCTCGRPKGRPSNEQIAHRATRIAQLKQGIYEGGSPTPTAADIELLSTSDPRDARVAGQLLTEWMNRGLLEGLPPQRTPRWKGRDGSPDRSLRGAA